jgi:hypothetical protein
MLAGYIEFSVDVMLENSLRESLTGHELLHFLTDLSINHISTVESSIN